MGTFVGYRDGGKTNEEGLHKELSRLFTSGMPVTATPTSMQATQRGAGANMSVDVQIGDVHIINPAASYSFWGWIDAVNNVVISAADPTNPRIDVVVAYVDLTVVNSASNNNPGALKFFVSAGTPAGSPVANSDGTIQTALGATTPFTRIATVTVGAAVSSISNAVITDARTNLALKTATSSTVASGFNNLTNTPSTVTYNGNRSYSLVFNGVDLTGTLSAGMRLRTTRTVAAPTQCTSLNGTTQFYSHTGATGMTFTDDFVVSAHIKPTSYGGTGNTIASRYNGTSGWVLQLASDGSGRIQLLGYNGGSGNVSYIISTQSVPLNKQSHIAAQLDMSSFTATPTTSYIMIDGVDVPASVVRGGTNPTALVQAGNLEIGSQNGGLIPFAGKIAQVAIYSAKVTEANIVATISQGLAGTETSLISAYSLSNSINDLNANANNLTANGSATATNADSPFGGQAGGSISSTLDYGIIQSVSFSTNTTVIVQVPEGCTIPTTGGVSAVSYSSQGVPYGFPKQRGKWRVQFISRVDVTQGSAASGTWYNPNFQISIPAGEWMHGHEEVLYSAAGAGVNASGFATLSTANNSEIDSEITTYVFNQVNLTSSAPAAADLVKREKELSLAAQTIYFLNIKTDVANNSSLSCLGTKTPTKIYVENAYL